jgi:hypothetical protein
MKKIYALLLVLMVALRLSAQTADGLQTSIVQSRNIPYEPAALFTDGPGQIWPIRSGEMVPVGETYLVVPIPANGYKFESWQLVNVFTFTDYTVDAQGHLNPPITSIVISSVPKYRYGPLLLYDALPETTLYDVPGVETIVVTQGWMANFAPVKKIETVKLLANPVSPRF